MRGKEKKKKKKRNSEREKGSRKKLGKHGEKLKKK